MLESLANPILELPDIRGFSEVAHKRKIPLVIDNTFGAGGYLLKPIEHGGHVRTVVLLR
jgi:O-acetylhomoserine/O-acetylserine sulfhydrylase-like pyridoxal-dependent enzyme